MNFNWYASSCFGKLYIDMVSKRAEERPKKVEKGLKIKLGNYVLLNAQQLLGATSRVEVLRQRLKHHFWLLEAFNLSVLRLFWSMYSMQLVNICHQLLHAFFGSDFLSLAFHFVATLCTRFQVSDCSILRADCKLWWNSAVAIKVSFQTAWPKAWEVGPLSTSGLEPISDLDSYLLLTWTWLLWSCHLGNSETACFSDVLLLAVHACLELS